MQYIEVAGMGHELPEAQWFEQAIELLDAAGKQSATTQPATQPQRREAPDAEAEARGLLSLAENYQRNGLNQQAIARLEQIVQDYPQTPSAEPARRMLQRLKAAKE